MVTIRLFTASKLSSYLKREREREMASETVEGEYILCFLFSSLVLRGVT